MIVVKQTPDFRNFVWITAALVDGYRTFYKAEYGW